MKSLDLPPPDFSSAMEAAQHYLNWYDMAGRTADRIVISLRPHFVVHIVCTDGREIQVLQPFLDTMSRVLKREHDDAKKNVAEIERQKKAEQFS